jgi:hypothetical protein
VYLACCLATIQLARKDVRADGEQPMNLPGGPLIPLLASLIIVWLMSSATLKEFIAVSIMIVVASAFYFGQRLWLKRN